MGVTHYRPAAAVSLHSDRHHRTLRTRAGGSVGCLQMSWTTWSASTRTWTSTSWRSWRRRRGLCRREAGGAGERARLHRGAAVRARTRNGRARVGDRGHRQLRRRPCPLPRRPRRDGARDQPHAAGRAAPARQGRLARRGADRAGRARQRDARASAQRRTPRGAAAAAGRAPQRRRRAPRSARTAARRDRHRPRRPARGAAPASRSAGCSSAAAAFAAQAR